MRKTRIIPVLLGIAFLWIVFGCSEDRYPEADNPSNPLSVKISFTGTQEAATGSAVPQINNLKLFFVSAGTIREIRDIPGSDVSGGLVEKIFTDISACPDEVIAIANTHILDPSGLVGIVTGSPSEDLGKFLLDHHTQAGFESPVLFYGTGTPADGSSSHGFFIPASPVVSCIKIGRIETLTDSSEGHIPLKGFKLVGIYINNTYTTLGLDGETVPDGESHALNYSSAATKWIDGAYPVSFRSEFYEVAASTSFAPAADTEWGYHVLPARTGTVIHNQKQNAIPHLILKIESAVSENGAVLPSPAYVTIRNITADGQPLTRLESGKVYTIASLKIGGEHLSAKPESTVVPEIKAEAVISSWYAEMAALAAGNRLPDTEATANCYMIAPEVTDFLIPVSHANADGVPRIGPADEITAELLWTDTENPLTSRSAIRGVGVQGLGSTGFLRISTGSGEGNAVVAVKVGHEIKWSWHIWVTSYRPSGKTGAFMDRNLGALSADRHHNDGCGALGLLYQWGRKDPFPGSASATAGHEPKIYRADGTTLPVAKEAASAGPNLEASIAHPQLIYFSPSGNCDWYAAGNGGRNNYLWNSLAGKKTPYDPCPAGWRIPSMSDSDVLSGENFLSANDAPKGRSTATYGGWYPAAGHRSHTDGELSGVGTEGMYWNSSPFGGKARHLYFYDNFFLPGNTAHRACALPVRCVRE